VEEDLETLSMTDSRTHSESRGLKLSTTTRESNRVIAVATTTSSPGEDDDDAVLLERLLHLDLFRIAFSHRSLLVVSCRGVIVFLVNLRKKKIKRASCFLRWLRTVCFWSSCTECELLLSLELFLSGKRM
jgi:hypothetical protein